MIAISTAAPSPAVDLIEFLRQQHRLPRVGDVEALWHYRGWLLPYVILIHSLCPAVANRWGYYLRMLDADRLLDEPIPQIAFGPPNRNTFALLQEWSSLIGHDCGGWSDFRTLLDWLSWSLALSKQGLDVSDDVNERLYRKVGVGPLLDRMAWWRIGARVTAPKQNRNRRTGNS